MAANPVHRVRAIAAFLAAGCAYPVSLFAQQPPVVASVRPSTTPVAQRVTLRVDNVALSDALHAIAAKAGLVAIFEDATLPANTRVTLHLSAVPADDAFEQALRGTGLVAQIHAEGQVAIVRAAPDNQAAGEIRGVVTDAKTKQPLRGVVVTLDDAKKGMTTDEAGAFHMSGVASGTHVLHVRKLSYTKHSQQVTVVDGETTTVGLALEASVNALEQVVVTGTVVATELKAIPNAITVITAKELEQRNITHLDQLFRGDVPGVWVQERGTATTFPGQVHMSSRGATTFKAETYRNDNSALGQTIKTYVDGVELADPSFLGLIDPKSVERVEILTGPQASTIYGSNAINGVMQIFTKRGTTPRPQLTVHLGTGWTQNKLSTALAGTQQADGRVSGVDGAESYNVGGGIVYSGAWASSRVTTYTGDAGLHLQHGPVSADGSYRVSQGVNLQLGSAVGDIAARGNGTQSARSLGFPHDRYAVVGQTTGATLTYTPLSWWSHVLAVGLDREESTSEQPPSLRNRNDTLLIFIQDVSSATTVSYNTTLRMTLLPQVVWTATFGADGNKSSHANLGFSGGQRWQTDDNPFAGASGNRNWTIVPTHRHGGYTQNQVGVWDALFFTYGVRWEYNPAFGDEANPNVQPRYGVALTKAMGPAMVKLRASYGHSTQPPPLGDKLGIHVDDVWRITTFGPNAWQIAPNPELVPSEQRGGEGGIEVYWGSSTSLQLTRYNQTVTHVIQQIAGIDSIGRLDGNPDPYGYCPDPIYCSPSIRNGAYITPLEYLNMGDIRNQGWEAVGTTVTGPLSYRFTYSWTKSRIIGVTPKYRSHFPDLVPGQPFEDVPEHTYAVSISYSNAATQLSLNVQGQGTAWRTSFDPGENSEACNELCRETLARLRIQYSPRMTSFGSMGLRSLFPGYAKADLNLTQRVTSWLDGTLQVNNVMDSYRSDLSQGYGVPGRQGTLGLRMRF